MAYVTDNGFSLFIVVCLVVLVLLMLAVAHHVGVF